MSVFDNKPLWIPAQCFTFSLAFFIFITVLQLSIYSHWWMLKMCLKFAFTIILVIFASLFLFSFLGARLRISKMTVNSRKVFSYEVELVSMRIFFFLIFVIPVSYFPFPLWYYRLPVNIKGRIFVWHFILSGVLLGWYANSCHFIVIIHQSRSKILTYLFRICKWCYLMLRWRNDIEWHFFLFVLKHVHLKLLTGPSLIIWKNFEFCKANIWFGVQFNSIHELDHNTGVCPCGIHSTSEPSWCIDNAQLPDIFFTCHDV